MVLIDNLISYYKLDEDAGNTTVNDAHGSNDGTASEDTEDLHDNDGIINSAFDFDSANPDNINITGAGNFQNAETYSVWFNKASSVSGSGEYLIGMNRDNVYHGLKVQSSSTIRYVLSTTSSTGDHTFNAGTINDGEWHHVAITFDDSNSNYYVYLDGSQIGSGTQAGDLSSSTGTRIGTRSGIDGARSFDGLIDEVGIWSRALSSDEVGDLWNGGNGFAYPFVSDVEVTPSTLTLSTTEQSPNIFLNITKGPIAITASYNSPVISIPLTFNAASLPLTFNLLQPMTKTPLTAYTKGEKGINKNYPQDSGLGDDEKHKGRQINLVAERGSNVPMKNRVLI